MYDAMDLLHAHAQQVEETVFFQTANLFNLEVDLIFYDTTTASFSVDYKDDPQRHCNATLRMFGHAEEGFWAPQVVVALAVTKVSRCEAGFCQATHPTSVRWKRSALIPVHHCQQ